MFYVAAQVSFSFSLRSNTFHSFVRFFQIHCKTDLPLLAIYTTFASLFWFLQTLSSGGLIQKNEPNLNTRSIIPRISKRIFSFASCSSPAPLDQLILLEMAGNENRQLHMFFFPFMAQGHMIPTIDMAKLFASRGIKATIITTALNAPLLAKTIQRSKNLGVEIGVLVIKFPTIEAGLPEGCESFHMASSHGVQQKFIKATTMLEPQIEQLLQEHAPDCLVADIFFPWATDTATEYGIPRLVFHGTGFFALCALECRTISS